MKKILIAVVLILLVSGTYGIYWLLLPLCSDTDDVYAIRIVRTEKRIINSPIIKSINFREHDYELEFKEREGVVVRRVSESFPADWTEEERSIDITFDDGEGNGFSEIEFILEVESSTSIKPIFKYSTGEDKKGVFNWITFSPIDTTYGLQSGGIIAWDVDDLQVRGCRSALEII